MLYFTVMCMVNFVEASILLYADGPNTSFTQKTEISNNRTEAIYF